jgi:hypothetical protein
MLIRNTGEKYQGTEEVTGMCYAAFMLIARDVSFCIFYNKQKNKIDYQVCQILPAFLMEIIPSWLWGIIQETLKDIHR